MLNQDHPDDERLAALAAGDADGGDTASLNAHVTACDRCGSVLAELSLLRAALAELPDVAPHRPLQLLPPVEADAPRAVDRLGLWARRLFAPALTAGAALAMVGVVGTALPSLGGMAQSGSGGAAMEADESAPLDMAAEAPAAAASSGEEAAPLRTSAEAAEGAAGSEEDSTTANSGGTDQPFGEERDVGEADALLPERSPWPMLIFAGIALMISAGMLRWILVPRAG